MLAYYQTKITQIGNSKGIRLPKEFVINLGTDDVILEQTENGILIKPVQVIAPLNEWSKLFASSVIESEEEFTNWDTTLNDGLENE